MCGRNQPAGRLSPAEGGIILSVMVDTSVSKTRVIDLPDEAATARLAETLAHCAQAADVVALRGDLGAGKSTFARAFIRALTHAEEEVPSPTFTLVQTYETKIAPIWHFDAYRLKVPEEALELDVEDAFSCGISLIEWPDRLGPYLPERRLDVTLEAGPTPESRRATLIAWGDRAAQLIPNEDSK